MPRDVNECVKIAAAARIELSCEFDEPLRAQAAEVIECRQGLVQGGCPIAEGALEAGVVNLAEDSPDQLGVIKIARADDRIEGSHRHVPASEAVARMRGEREERKQSECQRVVGRDGSSGLDRHPLTRVRADEFRHLNHFLVRTQQHRTAQSAGNRLNFLDQAGDHSPFAVRLWNRLIIGRAQDDRASGPVRVDRAVRPPAPALDRFLGKQAAGSRQSAKHRVDELDHLGS